MDSNRRDRFTELWAKYFDEQSLPVGFYFTDEADARTLVLPAKDWSCALAQVVRAFSGEDVAFSADGVGCIGGKRCFGFTQERRPDLEFFLSYGIPGKVEGERFKKTPELAKEIIANQPSFVAPARYLVFKRWDKLLPIDVPVAVIFLAQPDVLSGLFTLAGFDEADPQSVISPIGSGCSTIVQQPYLEAARQRPRAILGMLDVSSRTLVPQGTLSFAIPMAKFERMIANMDESFLIKESWAKVLRRIKSSSSR